MDTPSKIMVTRIKQQSSSSHPLLITHCVTVERDQTWKISVHGHELNPQENEKLSLMPSRIESACSLNHLLSTIDHLHVCAGHPDENFLRMVEDKKGKLISVKGTVAAYIDTNAYVELPGNKFVLSEKFCQDSVESFFSQQRSMGDHNDNPTVQAFCNNTVSIRLQAS